jgi:hypothetical protein
MSRKSCTLSRSAASSYRCQSARILADLANAYRLNGDLATGLTTVDEAIKISTQRHARIPELLARIVRADLLLRYPTSDRTAEGEQELALARALVRETGAILFERFINEAHVNSSEGRTADVIVGRISG